MSTSQILTITGAAQQSNAISSTRVKVAATAPFYYAVGVNPTAGTAFANTRLIPGNVITQINMEGIGNKVSILGQGVAGNISLTQIGIAVV